MQAAPVTRRAAPQHITLGNAAEVANSCHRQEATCKLCLSPGERRQYLHIRKGLLVLLQAGPPGVRALGAVRGGERGRAAAPGRSRLGRHAARARPQAAVQAADERAASYNRGQYVGPTGYVGSGSTPNLLTSGIPSSGSSMRTLRLHRPSMSE